MNAFRKFLPWMAGLSALAGLLYRFPPAEYHFYPVCPFYRCTGLLCPGCGVTRALAALLHGHVHDALQLNAFFVWIVLPAVLVYVIAALLRGRWIRLSMPAVVALAVALAAFTVARNLP